MNRLFTSLVVAFLCITARATETEQQKVEQINSEAQQRQTEQRQAQQAIQLQEEEREVVPFETSSFDDHWSPRPRPHYGYFRCIARDRGWEEHFRGHVAEGYNYRIVYHRALQECRNWHGSCSVYCERLN